MIYQRGEQGIWWYRFRFAGRMVHESAKTTSKTIARDAERTRRRELERNYNRIEKRTLPPTVSEASKTWLEKRAALAASTRETYDAALKHVKAMLGTNLVCELTSEHIASYQRARLSQGAAGATVNKELACLSSILSDCGVWAQIRRDVKYLDENEEAGRALSQDEERALMQAASAIGRTRSDWSPIYTVTVLGLNTGLRHSEVRKLRWKNLDLARRVLVVGESKTEAGSGRPVPLTQPACAVLDMWASRFPNRKPEHFVFPACEVGQINPERPIMNWRTAWRRATKEAKLTGLRFHDCRHTAATKLLEQGTPFAVVAQILGWSASTAVRMAKRYGHIRPEVQRQALEAIATPEIQPGVHQNVHQAGTVVESHTTN
jgi:integrase